MAETDGAEIKIKIAAEGEAAAKKAVEEAGKKAEETGKKVEEAGKKVEEAGMKTDEAGKKVEEAGRKTEKAFKNAEKAGKSSASGLTAAYEGFGKTVNKVGQVVGNFTKALGLIGFAVSAVQTVVKVFESLHEWLHKDEEEAKKLRDEMEKQQYAENVKRATAAYARLNEEIAKANQAEREKDQILDERESKKRGKEDAELNLQEANELATVAEDDPDADAKRTLIRNKYAFKRSQIAAQRASEDVDTQKNRLYSSADQDEEEAEKVRSQMQGQLGKNVDEARQKHEQAKYKSENATKHSTWTGRQIADDEARAKAKEQLPELERILEEAIKKYSEAKKKAEDLDESAKNKRKAAGELNGKDMPARINAAAEQVKIETSNRDTQSAMARAQVERKRDADKKARKEKEEADKKAREAKELDMAQQLLVNADYSKAKYQAQIRNNNEQIAENEMDAATGKKPSALAARAIAELEQDNAKTNELLSALLESINKAKQTVERANQRMRNAQGVDSTEGA